MQKVEFIVSAIDQASKVLNGVNSSVSNAASNWTSKNEKMIDASQKFAIGLGATAVAGGLFVKSMVNEAAQAEQTKVAFTTMTGSAANADKLIRDMVSFAAKTPFELKGLEQETKKLLAYGFGQDEVLGQLKNLGDIASGVGMDKLPQLTLAYGQVRAAGKLTGSELRQFTESGVPMLEELAKVTGISMEDMGQSISDGAIKFSDVQEALGNMSDEGGKFFNLMDSQSKTFSGMMSNLSDSWTQFLRTGGQPVMELLKGLLGTLIEFVNTGLPQIIQTMGEWKNTMIEHPGIIMGIATAITVMLVPALVSAAIAAGTAALAMLPLIATAAAIGAAVYLLFEAYQTNFLGIGTLIDSLVDWFRKIPENRKLMVDGVKILVDQFVGFFSSARETIKSASSAFWEGINIIFQTGIDLIVGIFGGAFGILIGTAVAGYQVITGDWSGAWETMRTTLENAWNGIVDFFGPGIEAFINILSLGMASAKSVFESVWNGIKSFFVGAWDNIKSTITSAIGAIVSFISGGGRDLLNKAFTSMMEGLNGIAKSVVNGIIGSFEGMVNSLINGINALINATNKVSPIRIPTVNPISIGRLAHGGVAGQGFFGGSVVSGPAGVDKVPAMLTAGEVVLNAAQQGNLARNLQGGNGGTTIQVNIQGNEFFGSSDDFAGKVGDMIMGQLKQHVAINGF